MNLCAYVGEVCNQYLSGFLIMMVIGSLTVMATILVTFGKFVWADDYDGLNAVLVSNSFQCSFVIKRSVSQVTYIGHLGAGIAIPAAFLIFWCLPYHYLVKGVKQQVLAHRGLPRNEMFPQKKPKMFLPWLATLFLHSILAFVFFFLLGAHCSGAGIKYQ